MQLIAKYLLTLHLTISADCMGERVVNAIVSTDAGCKDATQAFPQQT